jgi:hypothetical protein
MGYMFGTLSYFGIDTCQSKTVASNWDARHLCFDIWEATYYDFEGNRCGTSTSKATSWAGNVADRWDTTFYGPQGQLLGNSVSTGSELGGPYYNIYTLWSTSFFSFHEGHCGSSISKIPPAKNFANWQTEYKDRENRYCGNSFSTGTRWNSYYPFFEEWDTGCSKFIEASNRWAPIVVKTGSTSSSTSSYPPPPERPSLQELKDHYRNVHGGRDPGIFIIFTNVKYRYSGKCKRTSESRNRDEVLGAMRADAFKNPGGASDKTLTDFGLSKALTISTMDEIKCYYLSQAGFFNASVKIFKESERGRVSKAIDRLRDRARINPGGASEKTLDYFKRY